MTRLPLRPPSPSMAIALLALFISLGGVSYGVATGSVDSREIKNNTIRTRDIRNNDVRGRDLRNSTVRTRDVALNTLTGLDVGESKLGKVPSAGVADAALTPVAYAHVSSTGKWRRPTPGGVTDAHVSVGEHGRYCFRGLGFAFRAAQVLIDYGDPLAGGSDNVGAQVPKGDPRSDCGAGNQLVVATSHGPAASAAGFYVWFFA